MCGLLAVRRVLVSMKPEQACLLLPPSSHLSVPGGSNEMTPLAVNPRATITKDRPRQQQQGIKDPG